MSSIDRVTELHKISGEHHFLAKIFAANISDYNDAVSRIANLEPVANVNTIFVLESPIHKTALSLSVVNASC